MGLGCSGRTRPATRCRPFQHPGRPGIGERIGLATKRLGERQQDADVANIRIKAQLGAAAQIGDGIGQAHAVARQHGGVGLTVQQQQRRRIGAGEMDGLGVVQIRSITERRIGRAAGSERQKIIRPGQTHRRLYPIRHAPAPIQRQQQRDVRPGTVAHHRDAGRITAMGANVGGHPFHRRRAIVHERRPAHLRHQPVVRHHHHEAARRQCPRCETIAFLQAAVPAAAIEEDDDGQVARAGFRRPHVQSLSRISAKGRPIHQLLHAAVAWG